MSDLANSTRAELARQGVALGDDDLAAIVKIVKENRVSLAAAVAELAVLAPLAEAGGEPDVAHGFVPPEWPAGSRGGER